jgi:hypothetical protein
VELEKYMKFIKKYNNDVQGYEFRDVKPEKPIEYVGK